jgi:hypothetical protein
MFGNAIRLGGVALFTVEAGKGPHELRAPATRPGEEPGSRYPRPGFPTCALSANDGH